MEQYRRYAGDTPTLIHEHRRETQAMLDKFMRDGRCVFGRCFDIKRNRE